jgi:Predicted phosphatase
MKPVKRTWLGRFRHEAQTFAVTPSGRVAVYTGDDARFEYVYKFVTNGTYKPGDRQANMRLMDDGMLYVAKFNDDGTGEWLPLEFGKGPLTEANGFTSQGDVLIKTRQAADALGATKMDRPEDIEPNPVNQKVYMVMTNNTDRGKEGKPGPDAANPRAENKFGHIIEVTEDGNDYAATTFTWEIFMLCGDPEDDSTFFAGFDKSKVSPIATPDNITFDLKGNLWIATDGQPGTLKLNDGLFAVPVEGPGRGHLQQFFASVAGSEVCGPEFTPDNKSLFLAIQHPGEGGTFEEPVSNWPDGTQPVKPSVIAIRANNGGVIGQA